MHVNVDNDGEIVFSQSRVDPISNTVVILDFTATDDNHDGMIGENEVSSFLYDQHSLKSDGRPSFMASGDVTKDGKKIYISEDGSNPDQLTNEAPGFRKTQVSSMAKVGYITNVLPDLKKPRM